MTKYSESMYFLDIKDIWRYLEVELPFMMREHHISISLQEACESIIEEALDEVILHITGKHHLVHNYTHCSCIIPYSQLGWNIKGILMRELMLHRVSFQGALRVKHLASRTALVIVITREVISE